MPFCLIVVGTGATSTSQNVWNLGDQPTHRLQRLPPLAYRNRRRCRSDKGPHCQPAGSHRPRRSCTHRARYRSHLMNTVNARCATIQLYALTGWGRTISADGLVGGRASSTGHCDSCMVEVLGGGPVDASAGDGVDAGLDGS